MNGFLTRSFFISLVLAGIAVPLFAETPDNSAARSASFVPEENVFSHQSSSGFSGLATPETAPIPIAAPTPLVIPVPATPDPAPVVSAPLPAISAESVGVAGADSLGADMWKGTNRATAEHLLTLAGPSSSPVLNGLMQNFLITAATPPEGSDETPQKLTSLRIAKMAVFGSGEAAWSLATHADAKLIDDKGFFVAAQSVLTSASSDAMCAHVPEYAKTHLGADWQKLFIACQLRAKNLKGAQVSLDVYRVQKNHENVFVDVASKIITDGKTLPSQLTPLSPESIALLQIINLPLPDEVFSHADPALAPALVQLQARQDAARLNLVERAFARGLISEVNLKAAYNATNFGADELAAPLTAIESGSRLRALLFRAAQEEKDATKKIAITAKFSQSASPVFMNNAGALLAAMLGDIKPNATYAPNAAVVAYIYMLAGRNDLARDWLQLARQNMAADQSNSLLRLWPQFALSGLESDPDFAEDFNTWFDAAAKNADVATLRDPIGTTMLLMEAGGGKIPATGWDRIVTAPHNEKRFAFSPILSERLRAAGSEGKRAESILLSLIAASEDDIPLPQALAITHALRAAGFKNEAVHFAQQQIALLIKAN